MIQDIYPHKLHNEYHPDQSPRPDDAIICFVGNKILVGGKENAFTFPHRSELPVVSDGTYLFSLDRQAFYLVDGDFTGHSGSYRYHTLRDLRWHLKGPRENLYAAYTAYHLTTWYRENRFCGSCGQATVHAAAERALHCPGDLPASEPGSHRRCNGRQSHTHDQVCQSGCFLLCIDCRIH